MASQSWFDSPASTVAYGTWSPDRTGPPTHTRGSLHCRLIAITLVIGDVGARLNHGMSSADGSAIVTEIGSGELNVRYRGETRGVAASCIGAAAATCVMSTGRYCVIIAICSSSALRRDLTTDAGAWHAPNRPRHELMKPLRKVRPFETRN